MFSRCNDTVYRKAQGGNWSFMNGDHTKLSWFKGNTANVVPEQSFDFYTQVMALGKAQGMGAFEIDFLNYNFNLYPRFRNEPGAHAMWLKGMDDAAVEANVSIQYCMTLPQQMINSVALRAVTSTRVSGDGGRPYTNGGVGQLLAAAVGVRPFKDNMWTNGTFPKGRADVVASVLTMGPAGLADKVHTTVGPLAASTCARDGTLLHPTRPATPLDRTYLPQSNRHRALPARKGSDVEMLMSANYGPQSMSMQAGNGQQAGNKAATPWWYVVTATGTNGGDTAVRPSDLYPVPLASTSMVWWTAESDADPVTSACSVGAPVTGCVAPLSESTGFAASAAHGTIEVYHVAPMLAVRFSMW